MSWQIKVAGPVEKLDAQVQSENPETSNDLEAIQLVAAKQSLAGYLSKKSGDVLVKMTGFSDTNLSVASISIESITITK